MEKDNKLAAFMAAMVGRKICSMQALATSSV